MERGYFKKKRRERITVSNIVSINVKLIMTNNSPLHLSVWRSLVTLMRQARKPDYRRLKESSILGVETSSIEI